MSTFRSPSRRLLLAFAVPVALSLAMPHVIDAARAPAIQQQADSNDLRPAERIGNASGPGSSTPGSSIPVGAEAPIPSNFAVDRYLGSVPAPESSAHEPSGSFRLICEFSHLAYDDPIVAPGQRGASHLHMFFGNREADANSTYESLRRSGDSSCQGGPINRSAYWMPALFNGSGKVVTPEYITVYYKGPGYSTDGRRVDTAELPPGMRMIAGAVPSDPSAESQHRWYCERTQNKARTIPNCPSGELVGVQLAFPSCWNGKDLDAPDHRSHLAYIYWNGNGQPVCPKSHPVSLPEFTLGVWFEHDGNSENWYLASDRMPGAPRHANGSSFHSDWFGAWDPGVMSTWTDRCINGLLNCSGGDLGNRTALAGEKDYTGPRLLDPPPRSTSLVGYREATENANASLTCDLSSLI